MKQFYVYPPFGIGRTVVDIDKVLESFLGDSPFGRSHSCPTQGFTPAADIRETDTSYILEAELPGYDEDGIEVNVDGGTLSIVSKADKAKEKEDAGDRFLMRERRASAFSRAFRLPENADPETIQAVFKNGLLKLEVKKRTEAQKRVVRIETN
jgi:HSP20 family protein